MPVFSAYFRGKCLTCLVKANGRNVVANLECFATLDENTQMRPDTGPNHHSRWCGKPQGAGAGDDDDAHAKHEREVQRPVRLRPLRGAQTNRLQQNDHKRERAIGLLSYQHTRTSCGIHPNEAAAHQPSQTRTAQVTTQGTKIDDT